MILKNLFRRKGRTILTLVGISIGVAAIVALGALAEGMRAGYTAMARGSQADLVLTQKGAMDITLGGVEETVAEQLRAWPEVADADGMLMGNVQAEASPYFFIFGYDPGGFAIAHFRIIEGQGLTEARGVRGKPLILGRGAAQSMGKKVGDTLRVTGGTFRVVGIYETGDAFEEGGAVIPLKEAQALLLQPHRVSLLYIRLRDPADEPRLRARVERHLSDLTLSTTSEFADRQQVVEIMEGFALSIAGLAVVIGGVGMTNTLFMSVFERTREIGLLRAVGWRRGRVLRLILGESLVLSALGGLTGIALGTLAVFSLRGSLGFLGTLGAGFSPELFVRALVTVGVLGVVGGAYPAWWASRLVPLEALRYEGGAADRGADKRIAWAGMAIRNILRRRTRTALTALGVSIAIAAIVALGGITQGMADSLTSVLTGSQAELMAIEADVSDTSYSAIDERIGARIAALPDVEAVSGVVFTAISTEDVPMLLVFGYHPREFAIRRLRIVEGEPLTARRQALVGRQATENLGLEVGDTLRLLESRFRVVGIFETGVGYEESGVVIGLREAQALAGKPHQVTWYLIKLRAPERAEEIRDELNGRFPEIAVSLTSEFIEDMPDMRTNQEMIGQISFLAMFIGGVGMLNTMLMSVLERTREIGVLRALGWRRRQVLGMILREALALGLLGGICGLLLGMGLAWGTLQIPVIKGMLSPRYTPQLLVQALLVAVVTGALGGLYPAWRATQMRPVEALRYE
ncbi:MAG TPA: ABC transporter permease [Thermoflexia bacterium]|nr:ABC transporter permease [Thermoflexia bacterium]